MYLGLFSCPRSLFKEGELFKENQEDVHKCPYSPGYNDLHNE